jgi:high-affinity nickel-transport protein
MAADHALLSQSLTLLGMALLLGLRHGFDPDHIATIDALVRANAAQPSLARRVGLLFSSGHGLVVTLATLAGALLSQRWWPEAVQGAMVANSAEAILPPWLESLGGWISIVFLLLLGGVNILAAWRAPAAKLYQPLGLKSSLLRPWLQARKPLLIVATGGLFALSFDTIALALLLALAAAQSSGFNAVGWDVLVVLLLAGGLGLGFTAGMMLTDAASGWWVARMLRMAEAHALLAARRMGLVIGAMALLLGLVALLQRLDVWSLPSSLLLDWMPQSAMWAGLAILACTTLCWWWLLRCVRTV